MNEIQRISDGESRIKKCSQNKSNGSKRSIELRLHARPSSASIWCEIPRTRFRAAL
jgi:hypothetical protein